jgi:hypothetical protein
VWNGGENGETIKEEEKAISICLAKEWKKKCGAEVRIYKETHSKINKKHT